VVSHVPSLLAKTEKLLFHPNIIPPTITNSLWTVSKELDNLYNLYLYNLFTFILPLSQRFCSVAAINIKMCSYLQNAIMLVSENIVKSKMLFCVLASLKKDQKN